MSNPIGDRNLLFGILALEREIINNDALIAGMNAWVVDKRKGLAQILREHKTLTENQHALLEELVYEKLTQHGNDAQLSLATMCLIGTARQELEKIADPDVQASLRPVGDAPIIKFVPTEMEPEDEPIVTEVAPAPAPAAKKVATPRRVEQAIKHEQPAVANSGRAPAWALIAAGAGLGVVIAVIAAAAIVIALAPILTARPGNDPHANPQVQGKDDDEKANGADSLAGVLTPPSQDRPDKPIVVKRPMNDPPDEAIVVKPQIQDLPPDPVVIKAPVAKVRVAMEFILELPQPAGRACLSTDGHRLAYALPTPGTFGYREAPAFNVGKIVVVGGALTPLKPLASSLDGQRMAFAADSREGPRVYLWNWGANTMERTVPFANVPLNAVFSPDGKYLAAYRIQTPAEGPIEHWLHLNEIATGRALNQWRVGSEPNFVGFTGDNRSLFVATKSDQTALAFTVADGTPTIMPFPQVQKKYAFSPDFSKFAYIENPNRILLRSGAGLGVIARIDAKEETTHFKAAAFSPDNRYVVSSAENLAAPNPLGRITLVDLNNGKTVGMIDRMSCVPDRLEMALNGVTVLQGSGMRPLLFRFAAAPGELIVKPDVPRATPGFTSLFNGKDLTGWRSAPKFPGDWRVVNGYLTGSTVENTSARLEGERAQPRDFHLRMEARIGDTGGGEVWFRSPAGTFHGYRVPIDSSGQRTVRVGSLHAQTPGKGMVLPGKSVPVARGQWFTLEIIAQGNRLIVKVNGQTTTDLHDGASLAPGHINLGQTGPSTLEVRKIEIKELKPVAVPALAATPGFTPLFNGKDLSGWKSNRIPPGDWRVIDGILTGSSPNIRELYTQRDDYGDFHLRLEGRINADGNNFVVFRYPHGAPNMANLRVGGYAVRVSSSPKDFSKTGSLMVYELDGARSMAVRDPLVQPGQWFTLEIIAIGNQIDIKLNGQVTRSFLNPKTHLTAGGPIVLGFGDTNRHTEIEYRRIEIKEFKAVAAPAQPPPVRAMGDLVPLFNGKDLVGWRAEGKNDWKVSPEGDLVGQGPDATLRTKRKDFNNFNARIELSASADAEAFFSFRENPAPVGNLPLKGLTSRVTGDGIVVRAGYAGINALKFESGNQQLKVEAGASITLEIQVRNDSIRISANGKPSGGMNFNYGQFPPGAIGLHIAKGTVHVKKFEIAEEVPAGPAELPVARAEGGPFVTLFNGKDLAGWQPHAMSAGNWRVVNGILTGAGLVGGILHTTRADYKDFHLRMETRFTAPADGASSGIVYRSAFGRSGYESLFNAGKLTGGLYIGGEDFGSTIKATDPADIPSGEWFALEVLAEGNRVKIKVNGKETIDFVDEKRHFATGHLAFRQGADCKVEVRKIEIKEIKPGAALAPVEPPVVKEVKEKNGEFVPLFNTKDLAGWQPHAKRSGNWRVENGILIGAAPTGGSLYSTRGDYGDFHFRVETRINDKGFGRIFGRAAYDPTKIPFKIYGYEALINQRPVGDKTGALTAKSLISTMMTPAKESTTAPGEWFMLEIIAKGDQVTVKVNGAAVTEFVDAKRQFARTGHIVLHQDANAVIEFRRVEIQVLDVAKAGPMP